MGNENSCSCTPMADKKGYQNEASSSSSLKQYQQQSNRRDGHLLRLWAEVFHVSAASGTIRWQQVTQDLVPVNISCIQNGQECIFQVTAYTSRAVNILDTRIMQPGTRLGQSSKCFIYWKDISTGDTWGLNFTSPDDAKQFRELCSPSFSKISRKASSSYSLRLNEPPSKRNTGDAKNLTISGKRKPQSTPSSPSRRGYTANELQCTCMNIADTIQRQRSNGKVRYVASSTMPKSAFRQDSVGAGGVAGSDVGAGYFVTYRPGYSRGGGTGGASSGGTGGGNASVTRLISGQAAHVQGVAGRQQNSRSAIINGHVGDTNVPSSQAMAHEQQHFRNAQYSRANYAQSARREQARSMDSTVYPYDARASSINRPLTAEPHIGHSHYTGQGQHANVQSRQNAASMAAAHHHHHHPIINSNKLPHPQQRNIASDHVMMYNQRYLQGITPSHVKSVSDAKSRSKSSDDVRRTVATGTDDLQLDADTLKKMLHPINSSSTSIQKDYNYDRHRHTSTTGVNTMITSASSIPSMSSSMRREMLRNLHGSSGWNYSQESRHSEPAMDRSKVSYRSEVSRRRSLERTQCVDYTDQSPPPDHYFSDSAANVRRLITPTPSSSGDEGLAGGRCVSFSATTGEGRLKGEDVTGTGNMGNNYRVGSGVSSSEQSVRKLLAKVDAVQKGDKRPPSPTIKLLQEYEQHLRNALAKGCEADSYSLNTFETILSQSMENVVSLMREVQNELDAIRREEQQYRGTDENVHSHLQHHHHHHYPTRYHSQHHLAYPSSASSSSHRHPLHASLHHPHHHSTTSINFPTSYLSTTGNGMATSSATSGNVGRSGRPFWNRSYTLPTRGISCPPSCTLGGSSTSDLCSSLRKASAPIIDTLSIDSGLFSGLHPQASFESTDSRAYLTSSDMSDDERLSFTTAISDDEDGERRESPYRLKKNATTAQLQCIGGNRKSGFLSVKKWILRKRCTIELARKRGWKGYWVELKGTMLLFYPCDTRDGRTIESKPRHLILINGAIMQPIPEHPKRDFVFCLSTAFGDAYLFQAPCQEELELWISAIHNACGSAFARHRGKTGTIHLLQEEIHRLGKQIESDVKLKHLAERELTDHIVTDPDGRRCLHEKMRKYDENLEHYYCEIFRLRCYIASIQNSELPNPKTLLAHVSKLTKSILSRLGVFTVSSFHAFICARSPVTMSTFIAQTTNHTHYPGRRRGHSFSGISSGANYGTTSGSGGASTSGLISTSTRSLGSRIGSTTNTNVCNFNKMSASYGLSKSAEIAADEMIRIVIPPDDQVQTIFVKNGETIEELLWSICSERHMDPNEYYIRCKRLSSGGGATSGGATSGGLGDDDVVNDHDYYTASRQDVVDALPSFEMMQVLPKITYQIHLSRSSVEQLFGFSVEAELIENGFDSVNSDELSVYVSRVEDGSIAAEQGLKKGDEILIINGSRVAGLDMMFIESILQEELSLGMTILSCRRKAPETAAPASGHKTDNDFIDSLVCPPPPSDGHLSDEMIGKLIVPSPLWIQERCKTESNGESTTVTIAPPFNTCLPMQVSGEQIAETLLKNAEQVTSEYCKPSLSANQSKLSKQLYADQELSSDNQQSGQQQLIHSSQLKYHKPLIPMVSSSVTTINQINPASAVASSSSSSVVAAAVTSQYQINVSDDNDAANRRASPLSDAEKMRKVIRELVDTERTYVEHLNNLLTTYLEPIKRQKLISGMELLSLFGNIQEIVAFQGMFLDSLEEAIKMEDNFDKYCTASQFRNILFSIGNSFLLHADKFKLYSTFCASHSKAQKILHPCSDSGNNSALINFLYETSKGEHSNSLESHLIKPIQRVLKYPLLLNQLKSLTDPASEEHKHLMQALKGMERVAEHINEMQRIHEEYGAIFDHLQRQHFKSSKNNIELSPTELLHYGGIEWANICEFLGKIKKGLHLHSMCFVFKSAVVFLCKERIRQKKKLVGSTSKASEVEIIRYQVLVPVTEVQVRATSVRTEMTTGSGDTCTSGTPQYLWELIHLRCSQIGSTTQRRTEKVYQLSNSSNELRNLFLKTIRQIIRESVQKMPLPSSRPQSAKSSPSPENDLPLIPGQAGSTTLDHRTSRSNDCDLDRNRIDSRTYSKTIANKNELQRSLNREANSPGIIKGSKTKPLPPPRAPTTVKTSDTGSTFAQQKAIKDREQQSQKQTINCALCGADVGPGNVDRCKSSYRTLSLSETAGDQSNNSGRIKLSGIGRSSSTYDGKILEKQLSFSQPDS